jgi:hypothetical protein
MSIFVFLKQGLQNKPKSSHSKSLSGFTLGAFAHCVVIKGIKRNQNGR